MPEGIPLLKVTMVDKAVNTQAVVEVAHQRLAKAWAALAANKKAVMVVMELPVQLPGHP